MTVALRARYEADIAEADAIINIYLTNSVGIGEHPQHLQEIDKLLGKIGHAKITHCPFLHHGPVGNFSLS